ncbi:fatty acid-binding protein, intestinal [Lingula anatina]|uniref:Fatty acid-binding protein, intestinal n=1 Tax=Lingula anatina TaxID=7574 RepID=A0A1S3HVS0_LINAN|nr:fatty acid-binding protein, intestinal [Lingula anatina]|eukprot:XP_013389646.1 fatty acid-binding protein, intestinal [Lingula anatina]
MAPVDFTGTWKADRSENFEAFLNKVGVSYFMKKIAVNTHPTLVMDQKEDNFKAKFSMGIISKESAFTIGIEMDFDEFKKKMKTTPAWEGSKLVFHCVPVDGDGDSVIMTREIVDGELVQEMTCGEVTAKRIFKRVA